MNLNDIANLRLQNQQIAGTKFTSPKEIVAWMGAMQAQDYAMSKWAVGVRLPNSTEKTIEAALDKGEIIRTHVMRPTWHLVAAGDIRWMLALTAPQIKAGMKSRNIELELTEAVLLKSRKVLEKILRDGNHSTREELIVALNKANIATDENRASHIFMEAELESLICSGATKNGKQTFSLLEERVPATQPLGRDEALASLAKRYFTSHGPATLDDFDWWSGLSAGDARRALEMVKSDFVSEVVEGKTYWFAQSSFESKESAFLLPAFDEFIISYKDRGATLKSENHKRAVSSNGMFYPTVVVDGETVGIWKRTIKKDRAIVEFTYFTKPKPAAQGLIEAASVRYGEFLGRKAEMP
ncbi:MAG: AlkZ family DNA glycosylase [Chloroflexi bacterium]|nr:AlkZ family DNA glycosylase [Chloroflexota bacterium]